MIVDNGIFIKKHTAPHDLPTLIVHGQKRFCLEAVAFNELLKIVIFEVVHGFGIDPIHVLMVDIHKSLDFALASSCFNMTAPTCLVQMTLEPFTKPLSLDIYGVGEIDDYHRTFSFDNTNVFQ